MGGGDFEGTLENIISQLQSELDKGWEGIQTDCEPYEYCTSYYLYKHRPETDKEYERRMKEFEKQKEREVEAKEKRRQEYERLKKEFGND